MDNYTPPSAETIAYTHEHAPWNGFVSMVVLEGHAPSVWPVQVIETVGDTLIYTTDGVWYSVATRREGVTWWIATDDYSRDEALASLARMGMGERLTDGVTTYPMVTDPETGTVVPEALPYDEYPADIRAQIDAEQSAGDARPFVSSLYSPEGEPLNPHYGAPFGRPTSHPTRALTASMSPMAPVSAREATRGADWESELLDAPIPVPASGNAVAGVIVDWLTDPVIAGARFDPASGWAVRKTPQPLYARQGA